jgi:hypothetical protein
MQQAVAESAACGTAARSHPEVGAVAFKLTRSPTIEQLRDSSRASRTEGQLLLKYNSMLRPCRQIYMNAFQANAPLGVPLLANVFAKEDQIFIDLIDQKITILHNDTGRSARPHPPIKWFQ